MPTPRKFWYALKVEPPDQYTCLAHVHFYRFETMPALSRFLALAPESHKAHIPNSEEQLTFKTWQWEPSSMWRAGERGHSPREMIQVEYHCPQGPDRLDPKEPKRPTAWARVLKG
jgi:hypothetical protein